MRGEGPGRRGAGPLGADAPPPRARARAALQPSGAPRGPVAQEGAPQQGGCRGGLGAAGGEARSQWNPSAGRGLDRALPALNMEREVPVARVGFRRRHPQGDGHRPCPALTSACTDSGLRLRTLHFLSTYCVPDTAAPP